MNHIPMPTGLTIRDLHRFWAKTDRNSPRACWNWTASCCGTRGHARPVYYAGNVSYTASRVAYFLEYREDPGGLNVCHSCDNHLCVNPGHLWLGTQAENIRDCVDKGRRGDPSLHFPDSRILTWRQLHAGGMSCAAIARKAGLSARSVRGVCL